MSKKLKKNVILEKQQKTNSDHNDKTYEPNEP